MNIIQIQGPVAEPVSLEEVKNHLRIDADMTDDDALIGLLIGAARQYAEMWCGRSFITQKWRLTLDAFPGPSLIGVPAGVPYSTPGHAIVLERGVVQQVDSIQYLDMAGVWQTLAPSGYVADLAAARPRITPPFGSIWPITLPQIASVRVNYTAGYGDTGAAVPAGIRNWLLVRIATLYENREEVAVMGRGTVQPLPYVDQLLDPYRIVEA